MGQPPQTRQPAWPNERTCGARERELSRLILTRKWAREDCAIDPSHLQQTATPPACVVVAAVIHDVDQVALRRAAITGPDFGWLMRQKKRFAIEFDPAGAHVP